VKLGKKETVVNPNNYEIIFESDLPINLSDYNRCLLDYSGLYALYKNDMIKEEHMLLIHYDTQILHREWINIIRHFAKKGNVVFSEWPIDKERSEVARWVYKRIDDIFLATHGQTFLSFLKDNGIHELPNTSQFACRRETFYKLMEFLMPIYEYILAQQDLSFRYAHLLERAWGLFFALEGYKIQSVIKDSHSQAGNYESDVVDIPLLTTALKGGAKKFSDVLGNQ